MRLFGRLADAATAPVAIQNAPALMGRGLGGEITALVSGPPQDHPSQGRDAGGAAPPRDRSLRRPPVVLNGQAGLEMIDSLRAGCQGFVLAPDMVDHAVRIWRHWRRATRPGRRGRPTAILPEIVFAMRALEHLIAYGKRIFASRAGLAAHDRAPCEPVTAFGLACVERYAPRSAHSARPGDATVPGVVGSTAQPPADMLTVENLRVAFPTRSG